MGAGVNWFLIFIVVACAVAARVCTILDRREHQQMIDQLRQDNRDNNAGWHELVQVERSRAIHPSNFRHDDEEKW